MASALQLLATGLTDPIRGLSKFNKKMGAIWEIFDLLGVQINKSGDFEVTETVVAGKPEIAKVPMEKVDKETKIQTRKQKKRSHNEKNKKKRRDERKRNVEESEFHQKVEQLEQEKRLLESRLEEAQLDLVRERERTMVENALTNLTESQQAETVADTELGGSQRYELNKVKTVSTITSQFQFESL